MRITILTVLGAALLLTACGKAKEAPATESAPAMTSDAIVGGDEARSQANDDRTDANDDRTGANDDRTGANDDRTGANDDRTGPDDN